MNWRKLQKRLLSDLSEADEEAFAETIAQLQKIGAEEKEIDDGFVDIYLKCKILDIAITSILQRYSSLTDPFSKLLVRKVFDLELEETLLQKGVTNRSDFNKLSESQQKELTADLGDDEDFIVDIKKLQSKIKSFLGRYEAKKTKATAKLQEQKLTQSLDFNVAQDQGHDFSVSDEQYRLVGSINAKPCHIYCLIGKRGDDTNIIIRHLSSQIERRFIQDRNEIQENGYEIIGGYIVGGAVESLHFVLDMLCNENYPEILDVRLATSTAEFATHFYLDRQNMQPYYCVLKPSLVPEPSYSQSEFSDDSTSESDEKMSDSDGESKASSSDSNSSDVDSNSNSSSNDDDSGEEDNEDESDAGSDSDSKEEKAKASDENDSDSDSDDEYDPNARVCSIHPHPSYPSFSTILGSYERKIPESKGNEHPTFGIRTLPHDQLVESAMAWREYYESLEEDNKASDEAESQEDESDEVKEPKTKRLKKS